MSYEYNKFTVNLTLQHLSLVNISQQLWRQSDVSLKIEHILSTENDAASGITSLMSASGVIRDVTMRADDLDLPEPVKVDLRYYIKSMAKSIFRWLRDTRRAMIAKNDPNHAIKFSHFLSNLTWDNFGSVDGRKMLESYIITKETIDYDTWSQLCCYCTEYNIRKYSKCIDWINCKQINSMFSIFWYYKCFGIYPKDSMFSSTAQLQEFDRAWRHGRLDEDKIMRTMLDESLIEGNILAVRYFWGNLKDREKHELLTSGLNYYYRRCEKDYSDAYVFLLGQMDHVELVYYFMEKVEIDRLIIAIDWPWISCICSWKNVFDAIGNKSHLLMILIRILDMMGSNKNGKCDFSGIIRNNKYYKVVEELWECYRHFLIDQDVGDVGDIVDVGRKIVCMKDIRLCRIIFEDIRIRKCILNKWRFVYDLSDCERLDDDFWKDFIDIVLMDDNERHFFVNIFYANLKNV